MIDASREQSALSSALGFPVEVRVSSGSDYERLLKPGTGALVQIARGAHQLTMRVAEYTREDVIRRFNQVHYAPLNVGVGAFFEEEE